MAASGQGGGSCIRAARVPGARVERIKLHAQPSRQHLLQARVRAGGRPLHGVNHKLAGHAQAARQRQRQVPDICARQAAQRGRESGRHGPVQPHFMPLMGRARRRVPDEGDERWRRRKRRRAAGAASPEGAGVALCAAVSSSSGAPCACTACQNSRSRRFLRTGERVRARSACKARRRGLAGG